MQTRPGGRSSLTSQRALPRRGLRDWTTASGPTCGRFLAPRRRPAQASSDPAPALMPRSSSWQMWRTRSRPVDIPSAIEQYQNILQNASSKVDYIFGIALYMAPCDMCLHVGTIGGYNNLIIIAPVGQPLGVSPDINSTPVPAPVETGETVLVVAPTHSVSDNTPTTAAPAPPSNPPEQAQEAQDHEDEKNGPFGWGSRYRTSGTAAHWH